MLCVLAINWVIETIEGENEIGETSRAKYWHEGGHAWENMLEAMKRLRDIRVQGGAKIEAVLQRDGSARGNYSGSGQITRAEILEIREGGSFARDQAVGQSTMPRDMEINFYSDRRRWEEILLKSENMESGNPLERTKMGRHEWLDFYYWRAFIQGRSNGRSAECNVPWRRTEPEIYPSSLEMKGVCSLRRFHVRWSQISLNIGDTTRYKRRGEIDYEPDEMGDGIQGVQIEQEMIEESDSEVGGSLTKIGKIKKRNRKIGRNGMMRKSLGNPVSITTVFANREALGISLFGLESMLNNNTSMAYVLPLQS
ncbi:hypothetical protein Sjap_008540 [Stephania japonica]|uniref:Uncharacterized protein n=1 Tax=Stephania japonica TaxID=461633 RepID=A0AAP0JPP4_9MAGN